MPNMLMDKVVLVTGAGGGGAWVVVVETLHADADRPMAATTRSLAGVITPSSRGKSPR